MTSTLQSVIGWSAVFLAGILAALIISQAAPGTAQTFPAPCATVTTTARPSLTTAPLVRTATASPTIQTIFQTSTACCGDCLIGCPTPTQEVLASFTPTASPSQVSGNRLYRVVAERGLNVRADASINAPVTGRVAWGEIVSISTTRQVGGYLWGRLPNGWVAISDNQGNQFLQQKEVSR
jgi:uncharacterized protein YgiM (DUF1202 family)